MTFNYQLHSASKICGNQVTTTNHRCLFFLLVETSSNARYIHTTLAVVVENELFLLVPSSELINISIQTDLNLIMGQVKYSSFSITSEKRLQFKIRLPDYSINDDCQRQMHIGYGAWPKQNFYSNTMVLNLVHLCSLVLPGPFINSLCQDILERLQLKAILGLFS